ncbi:MAG TPA: S8/S53 family peptidase, partial [Actinomycetes bacterium]|nr:S8/S53 family peptidase [Actinomycetes bacterium]
MRVLVQFRSSPQAHSALVAGQAMPSFAAGSMGAGEGAAGLVGAGGPIAGLSVDAGFMPVQVPTPRAARPGVSAFLFSQPTSFSMAPEEATYVVRGSIPDDPERQRDALAQAHRHPEVVGVFSDPTVQTCLVCPGSPAVGNDQDVARLLGVKALADEGLDGHGVPLAIVDTGINVAHLKSKGRSPHYSIPRSWTPQGIQTRPGRHPVDHGTMCAFDAGIAAPRATLLDYAVLLSRATGETAMSGLLSDAVLAYSKLLGIIQAQPASRRRLVVSNSWAMFDPAWDFPVGHQGNYSDNPAHPFNVIVASLADAGADILFAAGNCGRECPDGRCGFGDLQPIRGANSHPSVLSIAGIDTKKRRVGYSSQGPGRLSAAKPDVCAYTHFTGSGVYPQDGGTSA